jgi:hypothetical protein
MRPAFDKGLRPESLSGIMLELASKNYTKDRIKYECDSQQQRRVLFQQGYNPGIMYSHFGDKLLYGGCVPTGV